MAACERGMFSALTVPNLRFQRHLAVLYAFRINVAILVMLGLSDDQNLFIFQNRGPGFGLVGASATAVLATIAMVSQGVVSYIGKDVDALDFLCRCWTKTRRWQHGDHNA